MNHSPRRHTITRPATRLGILAAAVIAALATAPGVAADSDDSITIYSSVRPGGVPASLYRPVDGRNTGSGIPGFAIVRHEREYDIERGTTTLRVADVAALIEQARASTDRDQRARLYRELQRLVHREAPWVFVASWRQNVVTDVRLEGFALQPSFFLLLRDVHKA